MCVRCLATKIMHESPTLLIKSLVIYRCFKFKQLGLKMVFASFMISLTWSGLKIGLLPLNSMTFLWKSRSKWKAIFSYGLNLFLVIASPWHVVNNLFEISHDDTHLSLHVGQFLVCCEYLVAMTNVKIFFLLTTIIEHVSWSNLSKDVTC